MNQPAADPAETKYWQGVMDGMVRGLEFTDLHPDQQKEVSEKARAAFAKVKHVHYASLIGPYCVICHCDVPEPYNPFWSQP